MSPSTRNSCPDKPLAGLRAFPAIGVCVLAWLVAASTAYAQLPTHYPSAGLKLKTELASEGYTLIHPIYKEKTFLVDLDGNPVHSWTSQYAAASAAYLLDDGSLMRATMLIPPSEDVSGRGRAGRLERIGWDGEILWEYEIDGDEGISHHDFEPLPNGHILVTVWDHKTREEAIAAGRDPESVDEHGLFSETIREIEPVGKYEARIVWEWSIWDHLIQDFDPEQGNYGKLDEHPGRIDINISGYNGGPDGDWLHINSVDYHPQLDQIMLSSPVAHELWIIDHSTTTDEAAGSTRGRTKRGGEILYRWGNPSVWLSSQPIPQRFFFQHDPHWIADGLPGAGNILIFNNGIKAGIRSYSTIDELVPPLLSDRTYFRNEGAPFPPRSLVWRYGNAAHRFFANRISGAQRLPNGNTLICIGSLARIIEVTPRGQVVWDYFNGSNAELPRGTKPPFRSAIPEDQGGPLAGGGTMFRAHRYPPDFPGVSRLQATSEDIEED